MYYYVNSSEKFSVTSWKSAMLMVPGTALGSGPSFLGTRPGSSSSQMVVSGIGADRKGC